ncbi:hypothetical protein AMAG_12566 [Allomyces macrogynus ATCC 38327]|uniref:FCP1 homology domain-containing protein n=1 Tax=Allomyces macrogynus (strain ATCC 38327) TaxID=578462 RepID=A0A0L0SZL1_ALLM3|nr:hypothetical protein AMAG_12566 [Allomyces macrogynus ATCC 38327]|eukprot:KNE67850.1 hypothetical protein AMAG_12566 [Allomyces macrogynus ATCC 38327]
MDPPASSNAPSPPPSAPPAQRYLIILDLNGCLIARPSREEYERLREPPYRPPPPSVGQIGRKPVYIRPHVETFLQYAFALDAHLELAVWTSANEDTAQELAHRIMSRKTVRQLRFLWTRSRCTADALGSTPWATIKDMDAVYAAFPDEYTPQNTIMVDDSLFKCRRHPRNALLCPAWNLFATETSPGEDATLLDLAVYLRLLVRAQPADVRDWLQAAPFSILETALPGHARAETTASDAGVSPPLDASSGPGSTPTSLPRPPAPAPRDRSRSRSPRWSRDSTSSDTTAHHRDRPILTGVVTHEQAVRDRAHATQVELAVTVNPAWNFATPPTAQPGMPGACVVATMAALAVAPVPPPSMPWSPRGARYSGSGARLSGSGSPYASRRSARVSATAGNRNGAGSSERLEYGSPSRRSPSRRDHESPTRREYRSRDSRSYDSPSRRDHRTYDSPSRCDHKSSDYRSYESPRRREHGSYRSQTSWNERPPTVRNCRSSMNGTHQSRTSNSESTTRPASTSGYANTASQHQDAEGGGPLSDPESANSANGDAGQFYGAYQGAQGYYDPNQGYYGTGQAYGASYQGFGAYQGFGVYQGYGQGYGAGQWSGAYSAHYANPRYGAPQGFNTQQQQLQQPSFAAHPDHNDPRAAWAATVQPQMDADDDDFMQRQNHTKP